MWSLMQMVISQNSLNKIQEAKTKAATIRVMCKTAIREEAIKVVVVEVLVVVEAVVTDTAKAMAAAVVTTTSCMVKTSAKVELH